jgi:hypothetical protein
MCPLVEPHALGGRVNLCICLNKGHAEPPTRLKSAARSHSRGNDRPPTDVRTQSARPALERDGRTPCAGLHHPAATGLHLPAPWDCTPVREGHLDGHLVPRVWLASHRPLCRYRAARMPSPLARRAAQPRPATARRTRLRPAKEVRWHAHSQPPERRGECLRGGACRIAAAHRPPERTRPPDGERGRREPPRSHRHAA